MSRSVLFFAGWVLGAALAISSPSAAGSITYTFPGPPPCNTTLQACIDGSGAGNPIEIATSAAIDEDLTIAGYITLRSASGYTAQIGAGPTNRVISIADAGAASTIGVILENLRLVNARIDVFLAAGGNHYVRLSELSVRNEVDSNNTPGIGVDVRAPADVVVERSGVVSSGSGIDVNFLLSAGTASVTATGNVVTTSLPALSANGIAVDLRGTGTVTARILSNAIYGVTGCNCGGAAGISIDIIDYAGTATVDVINNTLDDLESAGADGIRVDPPSGSGSVAVNVFNNIVTRAGLLGVELPPSIPQLTVAHDFNDLFANPANDFGGYPAGGSTSSFDPLYRNADAGLFHLDATSPAIGAGTLSPPGGLPAIDAEGGPRVEGTGVDLGAYEFPSWLLFRDGFESGDPCLWSALSPAVCP